MASLVMDGVSAEGLRFVPIQLPTHYRTRLLRASDGTGDEGTDEKEKLALRLAIIFGYDPSTCIGSVKEGRLADVALLIGHLSLSQVGSGETAQGRGEEGLCVSTELLAKQVTAMTIRTQQAAFGNQSGFGYQRSTAA